MVVIIVIDVYTVIIVINVWCPYCIQTCLNAANIFFAFKKEISICLIA